MRRQITEVEIVGGLGNQLFGFAAGLYHSKKTGSKLSLDLSLVGIGGPNHGRTLMNFSIPQVYFSEKAKHFGIKNHLLTRVINKISRKSPIFKKLREVIFQEYRASHLGFEDKFWNLKSPKKLKGDFQTYIYANEILDLLHQYLKLKEPSKWFTDMESKAAESSPIAIHMRRGDYLNSPNDFGILDTKYYTNALQTLGPDNLKRPIWIFTDSPEIVELELSDSILNDALIIQPPSESSPNESLILMSLCNTIIISNSTFSWWGAFLSSEEATVLVPQKWFKGKEDPEYLFPKNWHRVENFWQDS